jgi:acyl transferase domain-containing protein
MSIQSGSHRTRSQDIAIIGMSGRFPGAPNLEQFWRNLRDGVESISFFGKEELAEAGIDPAVLTHPRYVNAGGVLAEADMFDATFFGFNPREAEAIDPQQRVFLECAWHALEDAGGVPGDERIGVFAGCAMSSYMFQLYRNLEFVELAGYFQILIGNDKDYLATRVSYKLNLRGPSVTVQTACSTSLVAVCHAAQSLIERHCDLALAGGVNIRFPQQSGYYFTPEAIYSPDGHCRAFDAAAEGTVFGNGVGVVVLKRLEDALAAGDNVRAVIKGFAVNNDGALKVGYTAPGLEGQAEVIAEAQRAAGVKAETVSYVETHGTATALGDPIEVAALNHAFRKSTKKKGFCALGSVKSNIGHLDPAAGVASLIKTVLALENDAIPPTLHFTRANPQIDFEKTPFFVNSATRAWPRGKRPRRAGVSSFGIGGTNAHLVLEEAPATKTLPSARPAQLLVLSAKTPSALDTAAVQIADYLERNPQLDLADIAWTLQCGRKSFSERRATVCQGVKEAISLLRDDARPITGSAPGAPPPVFFLLSGQGSQYPGMAGDLYRVERTFRKHFDRCATLLAPRLKTDLREVVFASNRGDREAAEKLKQTILTQPAIFAVEFSLAKLWLELGVRPAAMVGHSVGEYVAACLAEVLSLEDALLLLAERGRLMQQLPEGAMLAVGLAGERLQPLLGNGLSLAAVNTPDLCVVSGAPGEIAALQARLDKTRTLCRRLETSHAFHSQMVDPILDEFTAVVKSVKLRAPCIPYVSNVTGRWITAKEATAPDYWAKHLRRPVRFSDALNLLFAKPNAVFVEVGPGQTLAGFARRHPGKATTHRILSSVPHREEAKSDFAVFLDSVGRLWVAGVPIGWAKLYAGEKRRRVSLPGYPFERQRYWAGWQRGAPPSADSRDAGGKAPVEKWFYVPVWKPSTIPALSASMKRAWLVFQDTLGVGARIAQLLRARGDEVVGVQKGARFGVDDTGLYTINPPAGQHYIQLCEALHASGQFPQQIVHCWSITGQSPHAATVDSFAAAQEVGFSSILELAQALIATSPASTVRIDVISDQLQSVDPEDILMPEKSTLLGICKALPQEYPNFRCRSIDLTLDPTQPTALAAEILPELLAESHDPTVAYRKSLRLVQHFEKNPLAPADSSVLHEGGVYLFTGGLGNIALALAEQIAKTARAKLILVGRSAFPDRAEWNGWLASKGENDPVSRKIRKLQQIESLGSEVLVCQGDVGDQDHLRSAIQLGCAHFGPLNGVIHGAGTIAAQDFQGIAEIDADLCDRHFVPKAHGLIALDEITADMQLDFVVLLSSIASVLAGIGFAPYSAANCFLDAYAHHRGRHRGTRWLAINWDAWIRPENDHTSGAAEAITVSEGSDAFSRLLAERSHAQVAVSVTDLQRRIARWIRLEDFTQAALTGSIARHQRPTLAKTCVEPRNETEQVIARVWQDVLGLERVGVHDHFFSELNGHSLLATQLVSRLRNIFEIEIPLRQFFDAPTVAELAVSILQSKATAAPITREKPLVAMPRERRRATVLADGKLTVSDDIRKELENVSAT